MLGIMLPSASVVMVAYSISIVDVRPVVVTDVVVVDVDIDAAVPPAATIAPASVIRRSDSNAYA